MADEIKTSVRQESYELNGEGSTGKVRLNRRGELVGIDQYQQWVFDGRVFLASNIARETAQASETSFSDLAPYLLLEALSGTTIVPLQVSLAFAVDNKTQTVLITLSDKARYTSGGAAMPKQNLRFDEPRTSGALCYTKSAAITAAANTDDITLFATVVQQESFETSNGSPNVFWSARQFIAPVLVGPAALLVYSYGSDAMPSFNQLVWAEFDTTEVIATS